MNNDFLDRHPRLRPLANLASELNDEDLHETILFTAYLKYRRRVLKMANDHAAKLGTAIDKGDLDEVIKQQME